MQTPVHFRFPFAGYAVLLVVLGCGTEDNRVPLHPVSGTVTVNGQPAEGALVTLFAVDEKMHAPGMPLPTGRVGADGAFTVTSYDSGDGAPAGEYKVGVVWLEVAQPATDAAPEVTRDRLKERYASPRASDLTVTITAGENNLSPFALK